MSEPDPVAPGFEGTDRYIAAEDLRARSTWPWAWLNPVPEAWWAGVHGARTLNAVRGIIPMYELSLDGLQAAVEGLMVRRAG